MTIDVNGVRERLRASADAAAQVSANATVRGHHGDAQFHAGRQAAFLTAINALDEAEHDAATERDENLLDERIGEEAARLGLIGLEDGDHITSGPFGERPYRDAANAWRREQEQRLEEFARHAGGAVDMASGTVYSDAEGGL